MPPYFFDTSALVKRYHDERGTGNVDRIFSESKDALIISNITIAELTSAFTRKRNEGVIDDEALHRCLSSFSKDLLEEFWILDLERSHVFRSRELILRHGLRALDALQLASVITVRELKPCMVCSDRRLLESAKKEGIDTYDPEVE
jgi:predicted nucleic acid-binding protein